MTAVGNAPPLPPRPADGHKGTFGTVLVVGGSCGARMMLGGPAFAALAALRSGCGIVELAMPEPLLPIALSIVPSATGVALPVAADGSLDAEASADRLAAAISRATVAAIGPGLGREPSAAELLRHLLDCGELPLVIDADGIVALAQLLRGGALGHRRGAVVLTPHPGECRVLAEAIGLRVDLSPGPDFRHRHAAAAEGIARATGAVVVLKSAETVVADGTRQWAGGGANAALGTAGSGDVLTGAVASLLAQWIAGPGGDPRRLAFDAAAAAVELHAAAARRWSRRRGDAGMLAVELAAELPAARARWGSTRLPEPR
jgi:hydroxyethylthiazole kinase-like uncharacterized protein yjeF